VIAVIGIDIGKNSFHIIGLDGRGAIALRQKWSRGQVETRLANMPACLIGMEACVGAHHLSRRLRLLGHDARLMPAKYVRPYSKGQKNDFRDAEAIAEAVQRPTMMQGRQTDENLCKARPHHTFGSKSGCRRQVGMAGLPQPPEVPSTTQRFAWCQSARAPRLVCESD